MSTIVCMDFDSGYHGPRPDQYRNAASSAFMVETPEKNSPMHLFKAAQTVYDCMIERREQARSKDLQELNRVLDSMETNGHLAPCDSAGYHKSYRQLAEFTRTHVQAEILHRLPKPPEWAPDFPDAKRLEKHLPKIMEYAILMMDSTPEAERHLTVPNLTGERGPNAPAYCLVH